LGPFGTNKRYSLEFWRIPIGKIPVMLFGTKKCELYIFEIPMERLFMGILEEN
jgi:hypothetical protein